MLSICLHVVVSGMRCGCIICVLWSCSPCERSNGSLKRTLVGVVDVINPEDALAPTGQGVSTIDAVLSFVAMGIAAVVVVVSVASRTIAFKCAVYCLTASATASFLEGIGYCLGWWEVEYYGQTWDHLTACLVHLFV